MDPVEYDDRNIGDSSTRVSLAVCFSRILRACLAANSSVRVGYRCARNGKSLDVLLGCYSEHERCLCRHWHATKLPRSKRTCWVPWRNLSVQNTWANDFSTCACRTRTRKVYRRAFRHRCRSRPPPRLTSRFSGFVLDHRVHVLRCLDILSTRSVLASTSLSRAMFERTAI